MKPPGNCPASESRPCCEFDGVHVMFGADTPGKSGTPTIEDVDEDSVKLSWTPPKSDGGDKVKGYVIEAKEKGSNKWKPLNAKSPCKDTKFTGIPSFCRL